MHFLNDKNKSIIIWTLFIIAAIIEIVLDTAHYTGSPLRRKFPFLVSTQIVFLIGGLLIYLLMTTSVKKSVVMFVFFVVMGILGELFYTTQDWVTYNLEGIYINDKVQIDVPFFYFMSVYFVYLISTSVITLATGEIPNKKNGRIELLVIMFLMESLVFLQLAYINEGIGVSQGYWYWNEEKFIHFIDDVPFKTYLIQLSLGAASILPIHLYDYYIDTPKIPSQRSLLYFPLAFLLFVIMSLTYVGVYAEDYEIMLHGIFAVYLAAFIYSLSLLRKKKSVEV